MKKNNDSVYHIVKDILNYVLMITVEKLIENLFHWLLDVLFKLEMFYYS